MGNDFLIGDLVKWETGSIKNIGIIYGEPNIDNIEVKLIESGGKKASIILPVQINILEYV